MRTARATIFLLIISLALQGCAYPHTEDVQATPLEAAHENYLSLVSGIPGIVAVLGSAVIIGDGLAVTNRHVVTASTHFQGYSPLYGIVPIDVVAVSDRLDLALLAVPRGIGHPLPTTRAQTNDNAWAMGTTAGFVAPVAQGVVANADAWSCPKDGDGCENGRRTGIMFRGGGGQGYSGGPLVDGDGELIGIVQGQFTRLFDADGRPVPLDDTFLFAYHISDVLAEAARLLSATQKASNLAAMVCPQEARVAWCSSQQASLPPKQQGPGRFQPSP